VNQRLIASRTGDTLKKFHWLNLAEYASLVGLGVGTVASFVSQQMLFTSAPLSFLVLLNLANRRRLESLTEKEVAIAIAQVDQKVNKHLELLDQQVRAMPTAETMGNLRQSVLRKNRDGLEHLATSIKRLQQDMQRRLQAVEKRTEASNSEQLVQLAEQYSSFADDLQKITAQVHRLSLANNTDTMTSDLAQLKSEVGQLQLNLQKLADQTRPTLTSMQDQVSHLNRQIQKLPPPFDSSAMKEEVAELIKMVSDMVPKRDWGALVAEVQALHRQQEMQAQVDDAIRQELKTMHVKLQSPGAPVDVSGLRKQVQDLSQRLDALPPPVNVSALSATVERLMETVREAVKDAVPRKDWTALQTQLQDLLQHQQQQQHANQTLRTELQVLEQQIKAIPAAPQMRSQVEQLLRHQLQELGQQLHRQLRQYQQAAPMVAMSSFPANGNGHSHPPHDSTYHPVDGESLSPVTSTEELQVRINTMMRRELEQIQQDLQAVDAAADYEFVFELGQSSLPPASDAGAEAIANNRATLEAALAQTQERLILIWPWSDQCELDDAMLDQFRAMLDRGCRLELGWCHVADRTEARFLSPINQRWLINPLARGTLHSTLQKFLSLKHHYPKLFQFKILGTIENFLVSDQAFAVLGINDALITQTAFPHVDLKLRTTDPMVIQRLLARFESDELKSDDLDAYWNRAVTRYDLGDRPGALADFEQIVCALPGDALAYNYRAAVRYDLGDKDGALADLTDSLQFNGKQPTVYCNRALIKAELEDYHGAIADYSAAVCLQPEMPIAFFYRGLTYQKLNNANAALMDYHEAIRLDPNAAVAYYHRAIIQQKLGDRTTAMADFETAAQLFEARGSHTNAQRSRACLAKLQSV
jgi:tetratricopeptide (TPR) repeat protein